MIKNDFRYIIKKIIIGLGIFIGIFYFKSCNVNASNTIDFTYQVNTSFPYYRTANMKPTYNLNVDFTYNIDMTNYNYYLVLLQVNYSSADTITILRSNTQFTLNGSYTTWGSYYNTYYNKIVCNLTTNFCTETNSTTYSGFSIYSNSFNDTLNNLGYISNNNIILSGNYDMFDKSISYFENGNKNNYVPPVINSTINSLNATPILSNDNSVLLGYNFRLNFDNFNTDNFVYKYKVGNSRTLILNSNNYELSIRNNDTLYVWVEDLEQNVVDNETFTISNVGNLYQGEYSIDFTYKDIAPADTENTTGLSNIIDRVDIDITYLPKTNKLKYQYQYVNSDGSLDPQNWVQLNNNNSLNNYTYVAHSNGTLYARILDENDNVVANNTFTVDSIGKLKLFKDNNNIGGIFSDVTDNINFSGPIYSLILMPINFINTIYSNSSNTCQRYKVGTLFNNDIYFECVDFSQYIGSTLYNLLDLLCCSGVIFGISRFIKNKYNQFTSLSDNDNDIM